VGVNILTTPTMPKKRSLMQAECCNFEATTDWWCCHCHEQESEWKSSENHGG